MDLLKIRLQVQKAVKGDKDYVGPVQMLGRVLHSQGFRGKIDLWKLCTIIVLEYTSLCVQWSIIVVLK